MDDIEIKLKGWKHLIKPVGLFAALRFSQMGSKDEKDRAFKIGKACKEAKRKGDIIIWTSNKQ